MIKNIFLTLTLLFSLQTFAHGECDQFLVENPVLTTFIGGGSDILTQEFEKQKILFSKQQQSVWKEALEHLVEDLNLVTEKSSTKDQLLKSEIMSAAQRLPEIFNAWQKLSEKEKTPYFKESYLGIWATFTVHAHEMLESKKREKDYPRLFLILKTIKDFDTSHEKFSFYKIRRAIQGRFSIKEYVNCAL